MAAQRKTRREFLREAAIATGAVSAACLARRAAAANLASAGRAAGGTARRAGPNILFAIADDWGWPHAGCYGDKVVKTPTFDRVAREGVLFTRAYCASPSCTPSRGTILTGQMFWRLEEGANLWSTLPAKFPVYPDLLAKAGYHVGSTKKGWGPGDVRPGGRTENPAGKSYKDFAAFLADRPAGKPFCFWYGSHEPHRPYKQGSGVESGKKLADVTVPPFLPDSPEVRSDILDYYLEVEQFDQQVGELLAKLQAIGDLDNTLIVMTGDNGMPFPHAKSNIYDCGTHLPLAVRWPQKVKGGRVVEDFISFADYAPTFLHACGVEAPAGMTGRSFLEILIGTAEGRVDPKRGHVFIGKERHTNRRQGGMGYPCRGIRTAEHLYIRNFEPDRWPAGDPNEFGDIDGGPTKTYLLSHRDDEKVKPLFDLACAKRPAEEFYHLAKDPAELVNVAGKAEYAAIQKKLADQLTAFLKDTADPRIVGGGERFDQYPYYGGGTGANTKAQPKTKAKAKAVPGGGAAAGGA